MHIRRDFELDLSAESYLEFQGDRYARLLERPWLREQFEAVMEEVQSVLHPAACYELFPIDSLLHERVILADGTRIGGGPVVEVVRGAEVLILAVCTVGPEVDAHIKRHQQAGGLFQMMILDELASWGVDQIRQGLFADLRESLKAERDWRVSAVLSPGESAWTVADQATIFRLLDASAIGVALNDSMLMTPLKSLSMLMGAGSQPMGVEGLTNCDFCSIKETCRYRHSAVEHVHG